MEMASTSAELKTSSNHTCIIIGVLRGTYHFWIQHRFVRLLIFAFIQHTSYFLAAKYGRQFSKLLLFIRDDFLRRLPPNTTAAKTRLELFLGDWEQNGGRFSEPNGYRYE